MKVFLTGGTGFVGSHVAELLRENGIGVIAYVRDKNRLRYLEGADVDLISPEEFEKDDVNILNDVDAVIHIAGVTKGRKKEDYFRGNVDFTRHLTEKLKSVRFSGKYIVFSSQAAAGPSWPGRARTVEDPPEPLTWYGQSKLAMEEMIKKEARGLNWLILRPPAVFGPRDTDFLISFKMVKTGYSFVPGGNDSIISIIYVKELAEATLKVIMKNEMPSEKIYFVARPEPVSVNEMNRIVASFFGKKLKIIAMPVILLKLIGEIYEMINRFSQKPSILSREKVKEILSSHWVCDPAPFFEDVGYIPAEPFEDVLHETLRWYQKEGWI